MRSTMRLWSSLSALAAAHALLEVDGALGGVDGARELDQHTIACDLEDTALMLRDQRLQNLATARFEGGERAHLVLLHEAAVTNHVGSENGGQAALDALFGHVMPLPSENAE